MMNIETLQAYPKSHFGPRRANGTLGVKPPLLQSKALTSCYFYTQLYTKEIQNRSTKNLVHMSNCKLQIVV